LRAARAVGNRRGEGTALFRFSNLLYEQGDRQKAIECAEAALKIREAINDERAVTIRTRLNEWKGEG